MQDFFHPSGAVAPCQEVDFVRYDMQRILALHRPTALRPRPGPLFNSPLEYAKMLQEEEGGIVL